MIAELQKVEVPRVYAMKNMPVSALSVSPWVSHLLDGQTVVIPYLTAGHHRRDDPAASPVVSRLVSVGDDLPRHPYTGKHLALVEIASGRLLMIEADRLAHPSTCASCSMVWSHLEQILDDSPTGSRLYEQLLVPIHTVHGAATMIVDAVPGDPDDSDPMAVAA